MKNLLIATLVAAAGWLAAAPASAAPVLSIVPSTASTTIGGSVSVDLVISGLTSSNEIVSGFDLDVLYDPNVLQATVLSTPLTPWGTSSDDYFVTQNFGTGRVLFTLLAFLSDDELDALQGDSFVLSTISFLGLIDGFSNIAFGSDPDFERNVVGRGGLSLNQVTTGTCVAVGTGTCRIDVPEPATLPLVLLALAAGGLVARRHGVRLPSAR